MLAGLLLLLLLMVNPALAAEGAPLPAPTPTKTDAPSVPMDIPIPVGETISGIKIPQYDESGNLSMSLLAGKARKIDDNHVEFDNLKVSFTDKEGKEILVEIPHAVLDTETKKLTADSKTVITRDDFDIIGEKAEFDTVSRAGTFKGAVRASFRKPPQPAGTSLP